MTTITELNAAMLAAQGDKSRREWSGYVMQRELRLGKAGSQNSRYRGTAGAKLHLLDVEIVVSSPVDGRLKPGAVFSVHGCTSGNGQHTGTVTAADELPRVDCKRCRERLDFLLGKYAVQA